VCLHLCAVGVDVTKLFRSDFDHGIEEFIRDTDIKRFHRYLRDYMDHGNCGRRNCSTCVHVWLVVRDWLVPCVGVGSLMVKGRIIDSYAVHDICHRVN
jgi:hypothetical protein